MIPICYCRSFNEDDLEFGRCYSRWIKEWLCVTNGQRVLVECLEEFDEELVLRVISGVMVEARSNLDAHIIHAKPHNIVKKYQTI